MKYLIEFTSENISSITYNSRSRIIPIIFFYTKLKSYRRACVDITATPPYV